ncbi:MAG TPA: tetratricopeptide repeat protein, partial [Longimicrobium sp.]|nr:tetratricopeptide repeat protein [Longimicrobium sp.]
MSRRLAPHYAKLLELHGVHALVQNRASADLAVEVLGREIAQVERFFGIARQHAEDPEWDRLLVRFACDCGAFFSLRGRYTERIAWAEAGLAAARRVRDSEAESILHTGLANIFFRTGRYDEALASYRRAYQLSANA